MSPALVCGDPTRLAIKLVGIENLYGNYRDKPAKVNMRWILFILLPLVAADKEREVDGAAARIHKHLGETEDDHEGDHQAVLGSRKAAEEFDDMPIEESKRRLEILAVRMDTNEDSFIDENELTNWVTRSMVSLDEEEVNERMTEMDTDGDKLVSWDEYVADSFPEQDIKKLDPDDKKLMDEDALYFKAADQNADGKLNKEELSAFLNPENYHHMHATLVEVTMKEKDLNKDGAIDLKEFLGEMADSSQSEWHKVESDRYCLFKCSDVPVFMAYVKRSSLKIILASPVFDALLYETNIQQQIFSLLYVRFMKEYDTDGDGVLRGEEVRRWLIPDVKTVAKQEASHLISGADKDKDGKLTISEILDAHQLFVGSEATGYGENLHKISHTEL
ncbi:EF hand [Necator americanus]|uniref:Reticulocalbin-3 n=1 Tax=Necator americanus TaxID=51031 RepID=W2TD48_NECAM|nr:EF hand [Necator americanus]ETN79970.1 EF hand [Necator americanus]